MLVGGKRKSKWFQIDSYNSTHIMTFRIRKTKYWIYKQPVLFQIPSVHSTSHLGVHHGNFIFLF